MEWYLKVLKNYAVFQGRARRKEYWMYTLFNVLVLVVLSILDRVLGLASETYGIGPLYVLYALAVLIPGLAVGVRRLHDIDKSGWWMLIAFIPLIGGIVLLVFAVMEGTSGSNRFGPDPKAGEGGIPVMA
ncbi:DUF805 domain-containing protein [Cognatiluteimonas telluris]|jgi:uncharacterized membrane protein YhaH (DUF805 family)|uniref:DUF805 domain-containing protein n=1 Tax=Cognatiluteimonas telluris TaxID=1104775 RepID=UPI0014079CC7|nr:DUF805 domain-containing protein [Lysobacter telluris]